MIVNKNERPFIRDCYRFFQHSEGRAVNNGGVFSYEYNLTDHLGNVRVTVDSAGSVIQKDDYYPFGLTFNSWTDVIPENQYLNQGKELQTELTVFDFEARMYDASLGKTWQSDPLAESFYDFSPYHWSGNNPISYVDPSGMSYYYFSNGNYHNETDDGKDDVYIFRKSGEKQTVTIGGVDFEADVIEEHKLTDNEGNAIDHDTFVNFAATVYGESSGNKQESYGIANAIVNFSNASDGDYKVSDMVSKESTYSAAVGDSQYNRFKDKKLYKKNSRYANGAVINALTGGKDYSNGATHWDGTDFGSNNANHPKSKDGYVTNNWSRLRYMKSTGHYIRTNRGANPTWRSTASYGKTIFWRAHPFNNKKLNNTIWLKYK